MISYFIISYKTLQLKCFENHDKILSRFIMNEIIKWHQIKYPLMETNDLSLLQFEQEYALNPYPIKSNIESKVLYEEISPNFYRLYLNIYHHYNLDYEKLKNELEEIKNQNHIDIPLLEHSEIYKKNYDTYYVIVRKSFIDKNLRYFQAYHFLKQQQGIIALEGKCGSGKTTLSQKLQNNLNIAIIPIDDFFLPPHLKTVKRLNEVGGNIDYERIKTLLLNIKEKHEISYLKYDCTIKNFIPVQKNYQPLILLEGVYSFHPFFNNFIDKMMYLDIDEVTQDKRLQLRNNYERFIKEWIPLENQYFHNLNIKYKADIII